jgi:excinuclease ABC subunit A
MSDSPNNTDAGVISIVGARQHNLKNISVEIPRQKFVVITGVSGSGKSTLAFDLLFAEGQRRFLDCMNVYARQFVEQLARPEVDLIQGIPPSVSIEQRNSRGGGKSTVATVTEIYHFIRLLYARVGVQFCPDCQLPVQARTSDELGRGLLAESKRRGDLLLLAPVVRNRKGFHSDVARWAARHGYAEIRADGKIYRTDEPFRLDRFREHDVEIVTGVLEKKPRKSGKPSHELIDETLRLGNGTLLALGNDRQVTIHSTTRTCPDCGKSFDELDPKMFSYNSARGWCPTCRGFGETFYLPEVDRGARADAIEESWFGWQEGNREMCSECHGARLNPIARAVRLMAGSAGSGKVAKKSPVGRTIDQLGNTTVGEALPFFSGLRFEGRDAEVARDIIPEIVERLKFLGEVGLNYLQLNRGATTLSGGEAQRIRLAAQLGSNLSGVLYILDEPTIGLHPRDNEQLLRALRQLKARGNTLVVVEHDEETMRAADYVIDLGPGAGSHGGEIVAAGTLRELQRHPESVTGEYLRRAKHFPARGARRPVRRGRGATDPWLTLRNANRNNLKNITVGFPLGRFVVVTGVSGSGKSTLIRECLVPEVQKTLQVRGGKNRSDLLAGFETLKAIYEVDQSPIGRTPRSIPATYVGVFDDIRQLYAQVPEARLHGYSAGRFSFNSAAGRCPECQGAGLVKLEMNFLPPAFVECESCGGRRFNRETLEIQFRGKNIAEVLEMSVAEAAEFFSAQSKIQRPLQALNETGLGYLRLGQQSPTLSGGEAQRLKLVTHLLTGMKSSKVVDRLAVLALNESAQLFGNARTATRFLFVLEEPTIGLHMADVARLVEVLQRLVDTGHSVIVIEHNLDLIAEADWVIDLGPEAGEAGGRVVCEGTPEEVARNDASRTGRFLRDWLK